MLGGGSGSNSATVSRRRREAAMTGGGSLFSRRHRQNSFSAENGSENSSSSVAGSTTAASTNGGGGGLMLRWANVRNRSRIPRKLSTSPATVYDLKTEATGNANTPVTDEEGFSVPPEDRWGSLDMHHSAASSSESSEDSDTDKTVGHSFKGIKVKIRPLGDLAPGVVVRTDASLARAELLGASDLRRALRPYASASSPRTSADRPTLRDYRSSARTAALEGTPVAAPAVAAAALSAGSDLSLARSHSLGTPSPIEFPLAPLIPPPPPPPTSPPTTVSYCNTWAISRPRPHTSLAQAIPLLTQPPARIRSSSDIALPASQPNTVQTPDLICSTYYSIAQPSDPQTTITPPPANIPAPTSTSTSLSRKGSAVEGQFNQQQITSSSSASSSVVSITASQITLKEEPHPTSSPSLVVTAEVGGTAAPAIAAETMEPGWQAVFPSEAEVYEVPRHSEENDEGEVAGLETSVLGTCVILTPCSTFAAQQGSFCSIVEESTLSTMERKVSSSQQQQKQVPPPPPSLSVAPPPPPPKSSQIPLAVPPALPPPTAVAVERSKLTASVTVLDPFAPIPAAVVLPIAVAVTETWRAQFPNGGGSSFSIAAGLAARHSITGQLILAVARQDLLHVNDLCQRSAAQLPTLVVVFNNCQRLRALQPAFPGVSVSSSGSPTTAIASGAATTGDDAFPTSYVISVAGDVLLQGLTAAAAAAQPPLDSEYTRLGLLNYSVDLKGLRPPITMCTFWRCEPASTDFRLDYCIQWPRDHSNVDPLGARCQDLRVTLLVDGGVTHMESHPAGNLDREKCRASWNVPIDATAAPTPTATSPVSPHTPLNCGLIRARFSLSAGPGKPQPVALQFCRDGGALPSGTTIALCSEGYRLTMCKYRLLGDRYFCDPPVAPLSLTSSSGQEAKSSGL
ncbi:unnamed protein product [Schistocephalus solidus]|uniref:MuHD domain-containing protein n=1 Tax=Schistocephalus solidus TaxID=70667 RepID=A0A183SIV7_SCHSO|nr:unnamed protein product [Schistocephalus solidus]